MRRLFLILWFGCLGLLMPALLKAQTDPAPFAKAPKNGKYFPSRFMFAIGPGGHYEVSGITSFSVSPTLRLNLLNGMSDFSFSLSAPLAAGYSIEPGSVYAEIPLLGEINFGNQATKDFYSSIGMAIGGGYNYFFLDGNSFSGLAFSASFRLRLFQSPCSFRYLITLSNDRLVGPMHGLGFSVPLGSWVGENRKLNRVSKFTQRKPKRRRY